MDASLDVVAAVGLALASPLVLMGGGDGAAVALVGAWLCYLSLATVGGPFYGYGWEAQLLETAALCALPFGLPVVGLRLLCLKVMLGAGLIKARAKDRPSDAWFDLSAMTTFFETQPLPGPLSRRLHFLPRPFHLYATASNHAIELVAPLLLALGSLVALVPGVSGVGRAAVAAYGAVHLLFQGALLASGNLSFLNVLTCIPALACFDDACLAALPFLGGEVAAAAAPTPSLAARLFTLPAAAALLLGLAWLNAPAYENLVAPARGTTTSSSSTGKARQKMNASFDRLVDLAPLWRRLGLSDADAPRPVNLRALRLANAFGAFGSVQASRDVLVLEGSRGPDKDDWREFDCRGQRADLAQPLRQVAPWHWRLDWQLWIAAAKGGDPSSEKWFRKLLLGLLENDEGASSLLHNNPFLDDGDGPPAHVRVSLYTYRFAPVGNATTWTRDLRRVVVRPVAAAALRSDAQQQRPLG